VLAATIMFFIAAITSRRFFGCRLALPELSLTSIIMEMNQRFPSHNLPAAQCGKAWKAII